MYGVPPDAGTANSSIVSAIVPLSLSSGSAPVWPVTASSTSPEITNPSLFYKSSPPATTVPTHQPCPFSKAAAPIVPRAPLTAQIPLQQGVAFEIQNTYTLPVFMSYLVFYVDDFSAACTPTQFCPTIAPANLGMVSLWHALLKTRKCSSPCFHFSVRMASRPRVPLLSRANAAGSTVPLLRSNGVTCPNCMPSGIWASPISQVTKARLQSVGSLRAVWFTKISARRRMLRAASS